MQQLKFIVIPGAIAILLFLGVDLLQQPNRLTDIEESTPVIDYNGYSEGINTVQYDELGQIRYLLRANRQVTYTNSETALEQPFIQLYQGNASRWNITARSGRIRADQRQAGDINEIILNGAVEVYQRDTTGNRTVLSTDTLSVNPDADILSTNAMVTLVGNNFEQTAIGMRIELATEEYIFFRDTRGRYAAP